MPVIPVKRDSLFAGLGRTYSEEEFEELCFEFGIELDDVTSEKQMARKQLGTADGGADKSDEIIYKIEIPANRYDLLCVEGLVKALRIFLGLDKNPVYKVLHDGPHHKLTVKKDAALIRPYMVAAVLRNVQFTHDSYNSFLDQQDKLHQNICRRRSLVSIGTHNLDVCAAPFVYDARKPSDIRFVPLNMDKEMTASELMEHLRTDPESRHLKPYVDIIYDSPVYPVFLDSKDRVLSFPPIINSEHSKMSKDTKNVFIDVTATDLTKAKIVLNQLVTTFSQYCEQPFTVEPVDVTYEEDSREEVYPDLSTYEIEADMSDVRTICAVDLDVEKVCKLCSKMQLEAIPNPDSTKLTVKVPPTRPDILHAVDVIEDVAIAYGYNNIPRSIPSAATTGRPQPLNLLTDLLREEISRAGYMEILTHGLCSTAENFDLLRRKNDGSAVVLSNPATIEFEVVRTTLLPGVFKTLQHNKAMPVKEGIRLFEISDVVTLDMSSDTGAKNGRKLSAVYAGPTAGLEIIHGLVDRVMQVLAVESLIEEAEEIFGNPSGLKYEVVPGEDPTYFSGRAADVLVYKRDGEKTKIGSFGMVHPEVMHNFELIYPCSALEIDLELFL